MERIQNASSQMPDAIRTAVTTILQATPEEVKTFLPNQIKAVLQLAGICKDAASACETAFVNISGLAQEMVLACTHKVSTSYPAQSLWSQLQELLGWDGPGED